MHRNARSVRFTIPLAVVLTALLMSLWGSLAPTYAHTAVGNSANPAFDQAAKETGVPVALMKALCYMEGRLSDHRGTPSLDGGYGCMHLTSGEYVAPTGYADNPTLARHHVVSAYVNHADTLDQAAKELGVSTQSLKTDLATSIRGGAIILRDDALTLSKTHTLPTMLGSWYGVVAMYSNATTRSTALMYADAVYALLKSGFSAPTDTGELVTLVPQVVTADTTTAMSIKGTTSLPTGCINDGKNDYTGAIDCILDPKTYNCNVVPNNAPCTYESANRPIDFPVSFVAIHDIEGTVQNAFNVFQNPKSSVSIHYIVGTDGTVYQLLHDKDIAYHAGNYWYNQRSIGIEHAGFAATGFLWYNATQYLASAKLTAYLLQKFNIPLDRSFVIGHENVPSPTLALSPNHVDPGAYWLWDYYFDLIHKQGIPYPARGKTAHTITLQPPTDKHPYNPNGTETPANFNFSYLYNGPSTASGLIPSAGGGSDVTDVTNNLGPIMSYYYLTKVVDPAGSGDTLYEIWYGEEDHHTDATSSNFADAQLAWLAVPPDTAVKGQGTLVALTNSSTNNGNAEIYGRPVTDEKYHVGDAISNSVFVSVFSVTEYQTTNQWYEINYNHRQAWVPATEVTIVQA